MSDKQGISELQFEHDYLSARLDQGGLAENDEQRQSTLARLDQLDLMIAATPAATLGDLAVKVERLVTLINGSKTLAPDMLETAVLKGALDDVKRMAAAERA